MEYKRTVEVACSFILHYLFGVIEFFLDGIEFGLAFSCSEPHFSRWMDLLSMIRCTILLLLRVILFEEGVEELECDDKGGERFSVSMRPNNGERELNK